ncbi:MAG TPA: ABC transporter ATP-binding protein [Candidatus Limnocylindria bacterium]|nr:ABC transporter ATP-binding protein [Candidatus Limnocylindria bacterium]
MTDTLGATDARAGHEAHEGAGHRGDTLLELTDLHVFYGNIEALKGISLTVGRGEVVTLIGSNGAGKSTTLRAISGTHKPRSGTIRMAGEDLGPLRAHEIVARGIAHSPEGRKVFSRMSVFENLQMGAFSRPGERIDNDIARVYDLFPRLRERRSQKAGTLSGGEQQMLAMGRALMAHPTILLLDEPSMGLSPILTEQIFNIISEINSQGTTVLLVEQNALMALHAAHRGYVIQSGKIILSDTAANLASNEQVRQAYLGEI